MDRTELINEMKDAVEALIGALAVFGMTEDEHSDEGNEQVLSEAKLAASNLETHVENLVP